MGAPYVARDERVFETVDAMERVFATALTPKAAITIAAALNLSHQTMLRGNPVDTFVSMARAAGFHVDDDRAEMLRKIAEEPVSLTDHALKISLAPAPREFERWGIRFVEGRLRVVDRDPPMEQIVPDDPHSFVPVDPDTLNWVPVTPVGDARDVYPSHAWAKSADGSYKCTCGAQWDADEGDEHP